MDKNFYKLKRKHVLAALLKSVTCGASAGLFTVGVVLLSLKLSAVSLNPLYYTLIGVGVGLLTSAALFLVFRPNDKKVARRLDEEYALHERVQTALQFSGQSGAIVAMQREDASRKLGQLPSRGIRISRIWQYAVIFTVAAAIAVTGFMVPLKKAEGEEDPYNRPPTEFEILAIEELISNVEDSALAEMYKTPVLGSLNGIIEKLRPAATVSEVMPDILGSIDFINSTLSAVNSYEPIAEQFGALQFYDFAEAVSGADIYKNYRLISYDLVKSFQGDIIGLLSDPVQEPISRYRSNTYGQDVDSSMANPLLKYASDTITAALEGSGVGPENGLYSVLAALKKRLDGIKTSIDEGTLIEDSLQHTIDLTFNEFTEDLIDALKEQCYTLGMNKFITYRMKIIFGMPVDDGEDNNGAGNKEETPGGQDANPDNNHGGGYGDGETKYGSDDEIFDPNTGKYVKYGELLSSYYAIVLEYISGGELTEEQAAMASYYFEILFGGFKSGE